MLRGGALDDAHAQLSSAGTLSYLTDALGSVTMLSAANQTVSSAYSFGAYGATAAASGNAAPFAYAGAEFNSTDQLVYLRNRFYSPQLQRFISEDPIGVSGGVNTYSYVGGDPVSLADPLGLWGITVGGYAGAGLELSFGDDEGHWFFTGRAGLGFGGGVHWERHGGIPGGPEQTGECGGAILSVSGKADAAIGPFGAGLQAGVYRNYASHESNTFSEASGILGGEFGGEEEGGNTGGFSFGASVGAQVTLYTHAHN